MDHTVNSFQPPPPLLPQPLPDLVSLDSNEINPFHKQQNLPNNQHPMQTALPSEQAMVDMMMDCSMGPQPTSTCPPTNWTPTTITSTTSSATYVVYDPATQQPQRHENNNLTQPPPSSPPNQILAMQPQKLPEMDPTSVVTEIESIMRNENDKVVLTNSVCLLFRFSIDAAQGEGVCQAMAASQEIMNHLYYVLLDPQFKGDDLILCYATGNLTNISKYEEGRVAILNGAGQLSCDPCIPSRGVESLIESLQTRDSNVVIFAITAIHNLLLDQRCDVQEVAKAQITHGLQYIVRLLDSENGLIHSYEFKVIVLDCLQILAYRNDMNRSIIRKSNGVVLLLQTIRQNLDHPSEELIETASRVLKYLSACSENKEDMLKLDGIDTLAKCIDRNSCKILRTCLWTLRNLSHLINSDPKHANYINRFVYRLLMILNEYADEQIITCALGILANITCNNEAIKQFICEYSGVELLLKTITNALGDENGFNFDDKEAVIEPAVITLCHLINQTNNPILVEKVTYTLHEHIEILTSVRELTRLMSKDLNEALNKLEKMISLTKLIKLSK